MSALGALGALIGGVLGQPTPIDESTTKISVDSPTIEQDAQSFILDGQSENLLSVWTDFRVKNFYELDYNRFMTGVTSPGGFSGGTAAFFQLATPTLLWVVRWTASRLDLPPLLPDPDILFDKNWVLLDKQYETMSITLMKDGTTPLFRISGLFLYGHKKPNVQSILSYLNFSRPPWISPEVNRNVAATTGEVTNTIDSDNVPSTTGGAAVSSQPHPGSPG